MRLHNEKTIPKKQNTITNKLMMRLQSQLMTNLNNQRMKPLVH